MTDKDYSLLRAFDLEAAKAGAGLIFTGDWIGESACVFVGNHGNETCVRFEKFGYAIFKSDDGVCDVSELRMAPLGWVEGKPVYKGDVLYRPSVEGDKPLIASHVEQFGGCGHLGFENSPGREFADNRRDYLTWTETEPKGRKLWVNVYATSYTQRSPSLAAHYTKEQADALAKSDRLACIEIELPPLEK